MQPETSWNYTYEPVTSSTATTTTTTITANHGLIDYNNDNNNYLGAQYYIDTITPESETQQRQHQLPEPHAAQQTYYALYTSYEQQQQVIQTLGEGNSLDTLSTGLQELGAIINGSEFNDITTSYDNNSSQEQASYKENEQLIEKQETPESIFEELKSILEQESSDGPTTIDQQQQQQYHRQTLNHHRQSNSLFQKEQSTGNMANTNNNSPKPYVEIIEQPSKCALRFRYQCEGRSAGSLPGVNSTTDNKTFPTIRIHNYRGRAVVVVSCVTKEAPYRAHPHNIVGKEGCKKGICTIVLNTDQLDENKATETSPPPPTNGTIHDSITKTFSSLGIQCVKRKDIENSLSLRESIHVDPFRNGFQHKLDTSSIDLNVVRLCFQVFIEGSTPNKCDIPLMPIVSDPIHDKKAMSDLIITKLSHCSAPATGGREIILLCDRIAKDDVQIRFFEESRDGALIWETYVDISPADVHKQVAICFKTPKYYNPNITQPVMARVQLRRISDSQVSEPRMFQILPCESDEDIISRKRMKIDWVNNHYALDSILH